jgi:flagellar hook-associated protein 1 FlgK
MGNPLASILATANSMRAFERAINVVQSNVTNASTAGYAKQVQVLKTASSDLDFGLPGGVLPGNLISSRNEYAEKIVRTQQQSLGNADERAANLAQIEPIFDISQQSGVAGNLTKLFQSFTQLSIAPNNTASRQVVLDRAAQLAQSFNDSANGLGNAAANADRQIQNTVASINGLVGQLQHYNEQIRQNFDSKGDPGLDANVHNTLEKLSQLVDYTALQQPDGTTTILLGGQTPALIGDRQFMISASVSSSQSGIVDAQGKDITAQFSGGSLSGLLQLRNSTIPSYTADLNTLATTVSDRVNSMLSSGLNAAGNAPAQNLFTYNTVGGAAATMSVNNLTPADVAAASVGAPGGNGNMLQLASLASSKEISGFTLTEFYGNVAGRVGRDLTRARDDQQASGSLLLQAKSLRADKSAVSLDEEAARLMEFQKSYQAAAKLVGVLTEVADTILGLIK